MNTHEIVRERVRNERGRQRVGVFPPIVGDRVRYNNDNAQVFNLDVTDGEVIDSPEVFRNVWVHTQAFFEDNPTQYLPFEPRPYYESYYVTRVVIANYRDFFWNLRCFFFSHYAYELLKRIWRQNRNNLSTLDHYKITVTDVEHDLRFSYFTHILHVPRDFQGNFDSYAVEKAIRVDMMEGLLMIYDKMDSEQMENQWTDADIAIQVEAFYIRHNRVENNVERRDIRDLRARYKENRVNLNNQITIARNRLREHDDFRGPSKTKSNAKPKIFYKMNNLIADMPSTFGILKIPFDSEGLCFPISMYMSQYREQSINGTVANKNNYQVEMGNFDLTDFMPLQLLHGNNLSIFSSNYNIDKERWINGALALHLYVESFENQQFGYNSFDECFPYYATALDCFIHVYIENKKGRQILFVPVYHEDESTWMERPTKHVYFYLSKKHFDPIIQLNKFLGIEMANEWCDWCQQKVSKPKNGDWGAHQANCFKTRNVVSSKTKKFIEQVAGKEDFEKFRTNPKPEEEGIDMICNACNDQLPFRDCYYNHVCRMKTPKSKDPIEKSRLFVLDIESMPLPIQRETILVEDGDQSNIAKKRRRENDTKMFAHECVLLCVKNMYDDNVKYEFTKIKQFTDLCISTNVLDNAVVLAHNGGGFDYQFILKQCDKEKINYEFIPTPNSKHKFLNFKILKGDGVFISFIDFMALVPGSLKGIAQAFKLPIQKGDFPLRFLKPEHIGYVGCLPAINHEDDYFCLSNKKDQKEVDEILEWYNDEKDIYCTCNEICECDKPKWDMDFHLKKYCWLDVDVLAEACKKYREILLNLETLPVEFGWSAKALDPFNYFTQSQVSINLFLSGLENCNIFLCKNKERLGHHWKQFVWMNGISPDIIHAGNSAEEYYIAHMNHYCDGFNKNRSIVYEFLRCDYDGCPMCFPDRSMMHPTRRISMEDCYKSWINKKNNLIYHRYNVVEIWEHEFLPNPTIEQEELGKIWKDREGFFGGRTEVASAYVDVRKYPDMEAQFVDVVSLYPFVCAKKRLPFGVPQFIFGNKCSLERLSRTHPDAYFGFAHIRVTPRRSDYLGLLPAKDDQGRLIFNVEPKSGFWHTEEIYLAMENGYIIDEVYQVIHFTKDESSDTVFTGYVTHWLRVKQESEGWYKLSGKLKIKDPTEEQKDLICQQVYEDNGFIARPRKENVNVNPVMRQIAKIFLNCLWGKMCQTQCRDFYCDVTNYIDFNYMCFESGLNMDDIDVREMNPGNYKMRCTKRNQIKPNKNYNIFIAASVTAHARCILHIKMLVVGPHNVLYCDTDSILYMKKKILDRVDGTGLGDWSNEFPDNEIILFASLAPKCYIIITDGEIKLKTKGVRMNVHNRLKLNEQMFKKILYAYLKRDESLEVLLNNFSIYPNSLNADLSYGTMLMRYNQKRIGCVYSKREVCLEIGEIPDDADTFYEAVNRIKLFPQGYLDN